MQNLSPQAQTPKIGPPVQARCRPSNLGALLGPFAKLTVQCLVACRSGRMMNPSTVSWTPLLCARSWTEYRPTWAAGRQWSLLRSDFLASRFTAEVNGCCTAEERYVTRLDKSFRLHQLLHSFLTGIEFEGL